MFSVLKKTFFNHKSVLRHIYPLDNSKNKWKTFVWALKLQRYRSYHKDALYDRVNVEKYADLIFKNKTTIYLTFIHF